MKKEYKTQLGRRALKKRVEEILSGDFQKQKEKLLHYPLKSLLNPLFIALCHKQELIRWNAVAAFALVVPLLPEEDGRIVMRRFLWSLNDESGGIGWGAPEAMAAIMAESELLRKEYLHMLISYMEDDGEELFEDGNFLELPMLQRGLLWGIGLLCHKFPDIADERVKTDISFYLNSEDNEVAAIALWALSGIDNSNNGLEVETKKNISALNLKRFHENPVFFSLYINGKIKKIETSELVSKITKHR